MLLGYQFTLVPLDLEGRVPPREVVLEKKEPEPPAVTPVEEDPRWVRLVQTIMHALLPFAEARLAVSRGIAAMLEAGSSP